ncbi:MAG: alpha/beta fold hydrolase [Granulosicoccus sp.]
MQWADFKEQTIATDSGALYARIGGSGEPLLLLHGFPQTHLMWASVAPSLAKNRQVICFDLPGYGNSDTPADIEAASKRAMAVQTGQAMAALGFDSFDIAGHDRGARVAYRMALDNPQLVKRLAVLDILPTSEYWARMDASFAMGIYHWLFLAQPEPLPERLIGAAPDYFIEHTLASWTASKSLSCFSASALEAYCQQARDPRRLKAMCDDYRAGQTLDCAHDLADRSVHKIGCPTLVLWGDAGIASKADTPLQTWAHWCEDVQGRGIDSGHFIPEENPSAVIAALHEFFS